MQGLSALRSQLARGKGVAIADVTAIEADLEPLGALLRRAMGERFRHHHALRFLLDAVVANGLCRAYAGLDISRIQQIALFGRSAPHPGEAISLQLETHRQR